MEKMYDDENTLKIRLAIAATFFVCVIFWDLTGKSFLTISSQKLFNALEMDLENVLKIWALSLTK